MGVSGAGKTAVGAALAARLGWAFVDADDLHPVANVEKMRRGIPLTEEDRIPWIRALARAVAEWSRTGRDVVLACSALRRSHRDALRAGASDPGSIGFAYLAGGPADIGPRLRARIGHFMPASLLQSQLDALEAPDAAEALAVPIGAPVGETVDAIVAGLALDPAGRGRRTP